MEELTKEEYASFQETEAQFGADMGGAVGGLEWDKDGPEPSAPNPPPAPATAAPGENKDLQTILKSIGRFDALTRSLDTRLKAVEKMGEGPSNGAGTATAAPGSPEASPDDMDDIYKSMASNLKLMMMKSMIDSFQTKPAPVASSDNGQMRMLMDEMKALKLEIGNSKNIEPQLINSLQAQVESMRQETARREDNKILQAIMQTRQQGPSELETFMAGMNQGQQQQTLSSGQDAMMQGQAEFSRAAADLLRGDGSAPLRSTARDMLSLSVEAQRNQMMVDVNRTNAGQPPGVQGSPVQGSPVQEVSLDQVAQDIDSMPGPDYWTPSDDISVERMMPGLNLGRHPEEDEMQGDGGY